MAIHRCTEHKIADKCPDCRLAQKMTELKKKITLDKHELEEIRNCLAELAHLRTDISPRVRKLLWPNSPSKGIS